MSETVTGAELARLVLRRGTTAAEVAAMDLESLTRLVEHRHQKKIPSGAIIPGVTDEQIARAILEYAQSDPSDWSVAPRETTSKRACGPGLSGALGGGLGAIVFGIVGGIVLVEGYWVVDMELVLAILVAPVPASWAAFLGAALALVVTRRMTGTELLKRAILPLATGLAVGVIVAGGYWLGMLAWEGQLDRFLNQFQFIPRSADTLLERYQAGERDFDYWNLRGANLRGADLRGADLESANLRGADLSGANLSDADLSRAKLRKANLSEADLSDAYLGGADLREANLRKTNLSGFRLNRADLSGADLSLADLSKVDLSEADLGGADLSGADLSGASLQRADLSEADLSGVDLSGADLRWADLSGANLSDANLSGAEVWDGQFAKAQSLVGATMPDGTVHE